ncbi:TetR family transcriptional regulator [Allopusillimonas soli]|uniref:TetR family transcriptional regulator n=1 Tax=Allopusillimonas soli TaxID=659016 RepID=A0A853F5B3_9BURK|nr:TetR family transcriptional regulator [Allopusillimonas soli]NYT35704.1 TetR family transcriptional regulator [Allopusillimonas soli]TEA76095.1 TetR family transcriptional regulator [Allopusillimonas soli]
MRVTKEQFAENREHILVAAGELFREKGFDGISIAEVMKAAGLTHGGFYRHFESKEDLLSKACEAVLEGGAQRWAQTAQAEPDKALDIIAQRYLSEAHLESPGKGCIYATMASDAARQSDAIRTAFGNGLQAMLGVLARIVPCRSRAARRKRAIVTMSQLVGAMVLARAVNDPVLAREILSASANDIKTRESD